MTQETARQQSRVKFEELACQAGISDDFERAEKNSEEYFDIEVNAAWWGWQAALSTQPQPNDETLEKIADEIQNSIGDGFGSAEEFRVILKILEKHFLQEPVPAPPASMDGALSTQPHRLGEEAVRRLRIIADLPISERGEDIPNMAAILKQIALDYFEDRGDYAMVRAARTMAKGRGEKPIAWSDLKKYLSSQPQPRCTCICHQEKDRCEQCCDGALPAPPAKPQEGK